MDSELVSSILLILPYATLLAFIFGLYVTLMKLSERVKALETHLDIIQKNLGAVEGALPYIEIMKDNFVNVAGQLLPRDGLNELVKQVNERNRK
ncbi:MAG: hypothetical protein WC993_10115 [Methanoculleus sp.]